MSNSGPDMSLDQAQTAVAGKRFPKITKERIESDIVNVEYGQPSTVNPQLTVCVITLRNGFSVLGKAAPAHSGNFDRSVGERYSYEDAFKQLWPLFGFMLREELHRYEHVAESFRA